MSNCIKINTQSLKLNIKRLTIGTHEAHNRVA